MSNVFRFVGIALVLIFSALLMLAVGGVLSSTELWHNMAKVAELAGIIIAGSVLILLISKK